MVTLSLLYSVEGATHGFAAAGAATGAFGLANVVASPYRARYVDRFGQRRALNTLAATYAVGLVVLALLTGTRGTPAWTLIGMSALVGIVPPPLGAAMRVLWSSLTQAGPLRARAYSVDAVSEELLFTTGPLLTALLIAVASPPIGLLATAALALVGTLGTAVGFVDQDR
ncbi:MFS transporter [Frondihabitans cladoniiphilus]